MAMTLRGPTNAIGIRNEGVAWKKYAMRNTH